MGERGRKGVAKLLFRKGVAGGSGRQAGWGEERMESVALSSLPNDMSVTQRHGHVQRDRASACGPVRRSSLEPLVYSSMA